MDRKRVAVVLTGAFLLSLSPNLVFAGQINRAGKTVNSAQIVRVDKDVKPLVKVDKSTVTPAKQKPVLPGFIQIMSQDDSIFLVARKDIKPEYADPCMMVTWQGGPEKFFAKNVADAIIAARPIERQNRAMQLGVLVRGDLNLCRIINGLEPVRGFCPGGAVKTDTTLSNLQQTHRMNVTRTAGMEDINRPSDGQRDSRRGMFSRIVSFFAPVEKPQANTELLWERSGRTGAAAINVAALEGIEEMPIIFYEPCEDFSTEYSESDRCGPGPTPVPEQGGGFAGSPIGSDSIVGRGGWASSGGDNVDASSYVRYESSHSYNVPTSGGERRVTFHFTVRVDHEGDYSVSESGYVTNPATGNQFALDMPASNSSGELVPWQTGGGPMQDTHHGNVYRDSDRNAARARDYMNDAANQNGVRLPRDCEGIGCNQADVNQARLNEGARAYEQKRRRAMQAGGDAGRPMCDFASSDSCGGDYTFGGFPFPDPIMDNLPPGGSHQPPPADCFDEFCYGGVGRIPATIPGTNTSSVIIDPLGPYINPALSDAGKTNSGVPTLPCGVLAIDVGYTYATDCMDPMAPNCWKPMQRDIDNLTQPAGRQGRQSPQIAPVPQTGGRQINRSIMRGIERTEPQAR